MASPSLTARARARAINGVLESSSDAERGLKRYRRCYLCESTFNASATTAAAARKRGKRSYGIPRTQTRAPRGPWGTRGVFFRCVIHDEERKNAHYPRMVRMSVRPLEPPPSVARSASRGLSFPLAALADFAASRDSLFRVRLKSFYVAASTIEAAPPPPPGKPVLDGRRVMRLPNERACSSTQHVRARARARVRLITRLLIETLRRASDVHRKYY